MRKMTLTLLPDLIGICRLRPSEPVPEWALSAPFFSITRTGRELSIVCADTRIPATVTSSRRWRAMSVKGALDFSQVGVIAALAEPLKAAAVPIFVISTYDTDYFLVRERNLKTAVDALTRDGHRINLRQGQGPTRPPAG